MIDLTNEAAVVAYMESCVSGEEWRRRCDAVKDANSGYPSWWYAAIVLSGVATRTMKKWGSDAEIHISILGG